MCLASFLWLVYGSLHFRRAIRSDLSDVSSELAKIHPASIGDNYKMLNLYYEAIHRDLPETLVPATALMLGSTVLFFASRRRRGSSVG